MYSGCMWQSSQIIIFESLMHFVFIQQMIETKIYWIEGERRQMGSQIGEFAMT